MSRFHTDFEDIETPSNIQFDANNSPHDLKGYRPLSVPANPVEDT